MSNLFLSLFLAAFMSFAAPAILIGGMLGLLVLISYIPGFMEVSNQGTIYILDFLMIFGDGKPIQGIITLGITVSIVGILLDILNFYRYQSLRDHDCR
ncbi:MAG: hypothetical protein AAF383_13525 [Cyanobacteria bacterium P01_A01_bin.83]